MNLKIGMSTTTRGGKKIICFDATEKFAYFAPYIEVDGEIEIDLKEVIIYDNEESVEEYSPVTSISATIA